jgi:class 3 adenylate cyclase
MMADTARLNEASGLPLHKIIETAQPDGSVVTMGEGRIGVVDLKWREIPVNWIAGEWFEHNRVFERGPLQFLGARMRLEPSARGARLTYHVTAAPATLFGRVLLATGFFPGVERSYSRMVAAANAFASGEQEQVFPYRPPAVSAETRRRIDQAVADIEATPHGHGLARRLADFVLTAQDVDLGHIRPLALARQWKCRPLDAIELCLQAVRNGLLELRWDLLCPGCRGAKVWSGTLDRLPTGAHCSSCNIDYDRDFSRNVEASFRPAAAIRPLESGEYCMWGPISVPHVKAQIALAPGESRDLAAHFEPGPYRLRTLEPGRAREIDWPGEDAAVGGGFPKVVYTDEAVATDAPAPPGRLQLENRSKRPLTAVIEDRRWIADALTADRVTALQAFRDLFSEDVLRPGDDVSVGHVALLFTDLKGSTALYRRIGDAAAYHLVRNHFAFLTGLIRDHEGTVIKTIGDAVMAAFIDSGQAVQAALAIQHRIEAFNRENRLSEGLVIKLGIHAGPTIAVTLNDRLDYFGSAVNMAARLQAQSVGGDLVLSETVASDPSVTPLLRSLSVVPDRAMLKGFEQPQHFVRVRP